MKSIISSRRFIQAAVGLGIFMIISYYPDGLWYILIGGSLTGIIFGKVFCRWMCPMGFLMELMMRGSKDQKASNLYNYHKMGCPIAWISGFLNKKSFFKIKRDPESCLNCGLCDKSCYIASINPNYSLYKKNRLDPGENFSCSKCLECVSVCPNNSLKYGR